VNEQSINQHRSRDEIVARLEAPRTDDIFGWSREVLVGALDFDHARPYLKDGVTEADWPKVDVEASARAYLEFAIGKIEGHRGISASRSVEKLLQYAWLLGRDDVVAEMTEANYPQYGAPQVKAFAIGMGWPWPSDNVELERMANGEPCTDDCSGGCGR
jgi:hypothetical protein